MDWQKDWVVNGFKFIGIEQYFLNPW
jgi:hypothetical protein